MEHGCHSTLLSTWQNEQIKRQESERRCRKTQVPMCIQLKPLSIISYIKITCPNIHTWPQQVRLWPIAPTYPAPTNRQPQLSAVQIPQPETSNTGHSCPVNQPEFGAKLPTWESSSHAIALNSSPKTCVTLQSCLIARLSQTLICCTIRVDWSM